MLTKDQKDQDTSSDSNNPGQNYWDSKINGLEKSIAGKDAEYPDGHPSKADGLANIEKKAEGAGSKPKTDAADEYGFYRGFGQDDKLGRFQQLSNSFKNASVYKKSAGIGGIIGIIALVVGFFMFLSTFQLIHLAESLGNVLDGQTKRVLNKRAAVHYQIAVDADGKSYYDKTGKRVTGRLGKGYASLDPAALREDLKKKGYTVEVDSRSGVVKINGVALDGKVSAQRNQLGAILNESYPQDSFVKRYMRSKTAFKAMGIQRVFFLENTKRKYSTWELEMISRLRERVSPDSGVDARVTNAGDEDNQSKIDEITDEANEISQNLDDPSYIPPEVTTPEIPTDLSNIDPADVGKAVGQSGIKTLQIDGFGQLICQGKYYLNGIEYGAGALRHTALIKHAGTFLVAAHQLKTGEGVSAAQMSALMTILNRDPGIGASGSLQLLNGNKNATVKHTDSLAVSFANDTGVGGKLNKINSFFDSGFNLLDDKGVPMSEYCKLTRNVAYQIGSGVVGLGYIAISIFGTPFTGGASAGALIAKASVELGLGIALSYLAEVAQPYLIQALAGAIFHYSETQGGDELTDGLVGGKMAIANGERYQAGMTQKLTTEDSAKIEQAIALEKTEKLQQDTVYQKYFALNNTDSTISKNLATLPSTPKAMASSFASGITTLPAKFASALSLFTPQGSAKAADTVEGNPYITANPLGLPQYGMTDETVEKINTTNTYDPVENENWIYDNGGLTAYEEWRALCYPTADPSMLYGFAINEDAEAALNDKCTNIKEERYLRYATYHLDRGIQQGVLFMSKLSDCTDPDSEDPYCTDTPVSSAPTEPTTSQNSRDGWVWPYRNGSSVQTGPCWGGDRQHAGMDINFSNSTTKVYAAHNGVVVRADENFSTNSHGSPPQGNFVLVKVNDNLYYNYQHLQPGLKVKVGDAVIAGETEIGTAGITGSNSVNLPRAHLHFGVSVSSNYGSYGNISTTRNPLDYLPNEAPGGYKCIAV